MVGMIAHPGLMKESYIQWVRAKGSIMKYLLLFRLEGSLAWQSKWAKGSVTVAYIFCARLGLLLTVVVGLWLGVSQGLPVSRIRMRDV